MPDRKDVIEAMIRERTGLEVRLAASEEELETAENEDRRTYLERMVKESKEGIVNVNKSLTAEGVKGEAPAKRAETRPAKVPEKRMPVKRTTSKR